MAEFPACNRNHVPGAPESLKARLKEIPGASDWKRRLHGIPEGVYLDSTGRPGAPAALKERLKSLPVSGKVRRLRWVRVGAAAAVLLVGWMAGRFPESEIRPERAVELVRRDVARVDGVVQSERALLVVGLPEASAAVPSQTGTQAPPTDAPMPPCPPLTSLAARTLPTGAPGARLQFRVDEASILAEALAVRPPVAPASALRSHVDAWGERLLERTGGRWGWDLEPDGLPLRFRIVAREHQWLALRDAP